MEQFNNTPLEKRISLARKIAQEYPDRIPVIIRPAKGAPPINKVKFLVPDDKPVAWFIGEIRKHIQVTPQEALFVFIEKADNSTILPPPVATMTYLFRQYSHADGFLYMRYALENTFG